MIEMFKFIIGFFKSLDYTTGKLVGCLLLSLLCGLWE